MTLVRLNTLVGSELVFQKHLIFDYRFFLSNWRGRSPYRNLLKKLSRKPVQTRRVPNKRAQETKKEKRKWNKKELIQRSILMRQSMNQTAEKDLISLEALAASAPWKKYPCNCKLKWLALKINSFLAVQIVQHIEWMLPWRTENAAELWWYPDCQKFQYPERPPSLEVPSTAERRGSGKQGYVRP